MEDISRKINEILSDPEMMEQIKGLAGMFGQGSESSQPKKAEQQNNSLASLNMPDPNMLGTMMKIAPLLQSMGGDDDSIRLLKALKPFLKEERSKRIDGAIKMLGFMKTLPIYSTDYDNTIPENEELNVLTYDRVIGDVMSPCPIPEEVLVTSKQVKEK